MKVFAINGSPDGARGNTDQILKSFLSGMREQGAEVDLFYTQKLKIAPCRGGGSCMDCWFKHPGVCRQKDDMNQLYPILREADVWVFATPVFVDGMSGQLKNFFDRIVPVVEPFFEVRDNHFRHIMPSGAKKGKIVLVSSCGFPEIDNFDPLVAHIKAISKNADREFAGALLRPAALAFGFPAFLTSGFGLKKKAIFRAAKQAGKELMNDRSISEKTLEAVSAELVSKILYRKIVNYSFEQQRKKRKQ